MKDTIFTKKWQDLLTILKNKEKVAIACSGGLDSRLLTYATKQAEIPYKIVHIAGLHIPKEEEELLQEFSLENNIIVSSYPFNPLEMEEVQKNTKDRCYHCKKAIFSLLKEKAEGYILCDGTNTDDLNVYRPGHKALQELSIASPYLEADISKEDIRLIAQKISLTKADQSPQACLLTRYDYDISLDAQSIAWLDNSENALKSTIHHPFRLRGVAQDMYELHIEADNSDYQDIASLRAELAILSKENLKIRGEIPIVFIDSLRSHFDKKHSYI